MNYVSKKFLKGQAGFTIVELLVVIVVIGILASITIVAYSGVTARANKAAAQASAATVAKKIEAYNAEAGAYPTYNTVANMTSALATYSSSSLTGSGITIQAAALSAVNNAIVRLALCTTASPVSGTTVPAGYAVYVWDPTLTTPGANPVSVGGNASLTLNSGTANTVSCSGTSSTLTSVAS